MHGATLTMSPIFHEKTNFPRSLSSPNIPDLANIEYKQPPTPQDDEIPRSASFTALPTLNSAYKSEKELQRVITANVPAESPGDASQTERERRRLSKEERPKLDRVGRRKSLVSRPKSWIQKVKGSPERQVSQESLPPTSEGVVDVPPVPSISKATRDNKTRTVSESFATFARKSWITSSRSPSPSRRIVKDLDKDGQPVVNVKMTGSPIATSLSAKSLPKLETSTSRTSSDIPPKLSRPGGLPKKRPTSVLMSFTTFNSANSSASSLPRSSLDNRSTPRTSTDKVPPLPSSLSNEKLQGLEIPRKRDELWSAFRSLENDYSKFQAKSWSLKTNVVRTSLLPFLRNHAAHPSNKNLRPEDLDRRVTILNKWWTGLLDVLDGRQNQTVSGVDRPILLDACYAIMTRPEWRLSPSVYAPLAERSPNRSPERRSIIGKKSTNSLHSAASQFMIESVYHNTRNLFIQNLTAQMHFVVEKMSLRHAPASLVTFCGKAAAYAFFFVPGIAEILVRIWKLQSDMLRRVSDELGMPRRPNKVDTDEIIAPFPAHTHCLGWSSVKSMSTMLRQAPLLPVVAAKIQWYGPWVARWCGRDSDLFFVFTKHYHILAEEFMPSRLPLVEKARAPGFILVQAQILTALEGTIHRQPAADPLPITFDDVLAGADATAAALPLPSNNSARLMAENRLIMLLRDFLSERPSDYEKARLTFGEAFGKMMQAGARRTSLFDHNACFVLCDFMEEALSIFVRFHHAFNLENDFIDWYFWMEVCQKMLESENSMSEIRLFAFLYGAWNIICSNERRKEVMCLDWLLKEETFDKFFNHWCPMVRAYFMRLLCWRLCRDDGEATDLDIKIFSILSNRIKSKWAYYLFLKQQAENSHSMPPSTAPCHPAPGRRLLIIRNDNQSPSPNLFLGFDGIVTTASSQALGTTQPTAYKRHSSLSALSIKTEPLEAPNPKLTVDTSAIPNKKRWTFMGKMMPSTFSSSSNSTSAQEPNAASASPKNQLSSPTKTLEDARRETAAARNRPQLSTKNSSSDSSETLPGTTHRAFSFKFSLEWTQHFDKPTNPSQQSVRGGAGFNIGPERRLASPRLPAPAQVLISTRVPGTSREIIPRDPSLDGRLRGATYSGRALAEWAGIVGECNGFIERRKVEGVPALKWIEVPTLGVEGFRRFG